MRSALPPEISTLNEKWLAENWLMAAGVVPESSADTLMMYAYAQPGVEKVKLEIDQDEGNQGKNPKVVYRIKLTPKTQILWDATEGVKKVRSSIVRKSMVLALSKMGSPINLAKAITSYAKEYLPPQYNVEVHFESN